MSKPATPNDESLRVLVELRPCLAGYTGIAQETRTLFSAFHDLPGVEPVGLLNHSKRRLARLEPRSWARRDTATDFDRVGKLIVSSEDEQAATPLDSIRLRTERYRTAASVGWSAMTGAGLSVQQLAGDRFGDYLWQRLFDKALPSTDFDKIRTARYVSTRAPWLAMHTVGALARYPRLDTSGFDVLFAQTPWPSLVDPGTDLVVRYQDAIPVFHPHQIKLPAMHQDHHVSALKSNAQHARFVCSSEATRHDLLTLYPHLERRTAVIPVSVSSEFFPEPTEGRPLSDLMSARLCVRSKRRSKQPKALRYLLAVSTVEPRKNHLRLIDAWERVRRDIDPDLALVIVGSPGWGHGEIMERIDRVGTRGGLFHLAGVPTAELRTLYSSALVTVCPSVAEGFDLSGIEAMLCGSPVVASDIPVHREVYGEASVYFDPYDTAALARALADVVGRPPSDDWLNQLKGAGAETAAALRHDRVAGQWSAYFAELADHRSRTGLGSG